MGLKTNDPKLLVKTIPVNAYIEEDFSGLTEEERANPPVIKVESSRFDFGKVTTGSKVSHDFIIRNEGTRDLVIRSTKASCGCTAIKPEKSVLAPGESSKVGIVFDTRGRTGKQHKTVTVITNDPSNHTVTLHVEGIVE